MTTFTFLVGCADCTSVATTFTDHDRRQHAMDSHVPSHTVAHFVAATAHPATDPASDTPTFAPGDQVTFHGSTTGQAADHQPATVVSALPGVDQDGRQVHGYLIQVPVEQDGGTVETYNVFVPTASLAAA